ncbi:hypothetical protein M3Y98_00328300 [Aphelenchoides besseyi]|nr:hypothetical protein M3Y98_00328300 [Aphelenchoides besseyi]KAI6201482.1 hypothetical protein M3Y96_00846600 [Aphelenchoides besseyi]
METTFTTTVSMSQWGNQNQSQASVIISASENENGKLQMPCLLGDIVNMPPSQEKISYGDYYFSTVCVVGQIVNITETDNHELHYEITDQEDETINDQTVRGTIYPQARRGTYSVGDWMVAFAKIRSFDGILNLLTFATRPADLMDVQLHKAQARCAKFYYKDNAPEKSLSGVVSEYIGTVLTNEPLEGQVKTAATNTQQLGAALPSNVPKSLPARSQPNSIEVKGKSQVQSINGTRGKILEFFQKHHSDLPMNGYHLSDIKRELGNPSNFDNEIIFLLNEGVLFNTHDSFHFASI